MGVTKGFEFRPSVDVAEGFEVSEVLEVNIGQECEGC